MILSGCGYDEKTNTNNGQNANSIAAKANPAKDNVNELLELILLPELPEEVVWREEVLEKNDNQPSGAAPKKLTAVLKYKPEKAADVTLIVEKNKAPEQVEIGAENWFPEELTAKAQLSGNGMIKGTAYSASQFLNVPYSTGRITRVEGTDYFVLELTGQ